MPAQFARRQFIQGTLAAGAAALLASASGNARAAGKAGPSAAASVGPDTEATIRVMIWSGLIEPIIRQHALTEFKKQYPKVNVELEINTNAEFYPKLLATKGSAPQYSGGMMNDLFTAVGSHDGMWAVPNTDRMPNARKIPSKLNPPGGFGYTVFLTGLGIAYNPDKVKAPTSWTDLYRPEYAGRVAMSDGNFGAYCMASFVNGGNVNDVLGGIGAWKPHTKNIGAWSNSEGQRAEMISSGRIWLTPSYGAWAEQERAKGRKIAFAAPKEGMLSFYAALQLIRNASPTEIALTESFFNLLYGRDVQEQFVNRGYFIPALSEIKIPDALKTESKAVMSATEASEKLVQYDVAEIARRQREYTATIQRTLNN